MTRSILVTLVVLAALNLPAAAKEVADPESGCKFETTIKGVTSVQWDGACEGGLISGEGNLQLFNGDELVWFYDLFSGNGAVASAGKIETVISDEQLAYDLSRCSPPKPKGYFVVIPSRHVVVTVPRKFDLSSLPVRRRIQELALAKAQLDCPPLRGYDSSYFLISVQFEGKRYEVVDRGYDVEIGSEYSVGGEPGGKWVEKNLRAAVTRERTVKRYNQEEAQKVAAAARKAVEDEARANYDSMVTHFKIDELVIDDSLVVNPYAYDGKRVAVKAVFYEMMSRDEGLYLVNGEPAVLNGMSWKTEGKPLLAVITGLDKQERLLPKLGNRIVLIGEMLAAHECTSPGCDEVLEWTSRN